MGNCPCVVPAVVFIIVIPVSWFVARQKGVHLCLARPSSLNSLLFHFYFSRTRGALKWKNNTTTYAITIKTKRFRFVIFFFFGFLFFGKDTEPEHHWYQFQSERHIYVQLYIENVKCQQGKRKRGWGEKRRRVRQILFGTAQRVPRENASLAILLL